MQDRIPKEFYISRLPKPVAETVGDLIEQLQRLPPELAIEQGFGRGGKLKVYNASTASPHLKIKEVDE